MEALTEREHAYFGHEPINLLARWPGVGKRSALMQTRWKQKTLDEEGYKALKDELRVYEAWNVVPPEQPYGSLDAPSWQKLGVQTKKLGDRYKDEQRAVDQRWKATKNVGFRRFYSRGESTTEWHTSRYAKQTRLYRCLAPRLTP